MKRIFTLGFLAIGLLSSAQIVVTEGFEDSAFPPPGWSTYASAAFSRTTASGYYCSGAAAARRNIYGSSTYKTSYLMYESALSNGLAIDLSFKYIIKPYSSSSTINGNMVVEYSADGGTTWTQLGSTVTFTSQIDCATFTASIPAGAVPIGNNFKFRITGNNSTTVTSADWYLAVDDVQIDQLVTCPAPSALTVSNITNTSATVSWTASTVAPTNGYDVYYSTSNVTPTASTVPQFAGLNGTSVDLTSLTSSTKYYVWVRSNCGSSDLSAWHAIEFSTECTPPNVLTALGDTVCPNATATLSGTTETGNTLLWYEDTTSFLPIATGPSYTTPPLTATKTYYVSSISGQKGVVGKDAPTVTTGNNGFSNLGLIFTAISDMTIKSIDFYPYSSSLTSTTVTFNLLNSAGTILETKTVTLPVTTSAVLHTIDLNFPVPAGTGYKLVVAGATSGTYALRENVAAQISYPYTLADVCSITGTTTSGYYYYLYNWKVSKGCESARQPVVATVDPNCLGTDEVGAKKDMRLYPNPFTDVINISDIENVKSVTVNDASGKLVKVIEKVSNNLNLGDLKQGIYLLNITYNNGTTVTTKVIKK